jgi:hypothetical protein
LIAIWKGLRNKGGFPHPELFPELNFKGSHKSVHGIPAVALISRPGNFRRKLEEEPGPVKIPSIE